MKCTVGAAGGWCGYCYAGMKARSYTRGHFGWRVPKPRKTEYNSMLFKRPAKVDPKLTAGLPAGVDPEWSAWYPALLEFITARKWDDGAARVPGTLSLFAEDGVFKAFVNDKDGERSACVSAGTVGDLLAGIDDGLQNDTLLWRPQRAFKKK